MPHYSAVPATSLTPSGALFYAGCASSWPVQNGLQACRTQQPPGPPACPLPCTAEFRLVLAAMARDKSWAAYMAAMGRSRVAATLRQGPLPLHVAFIMDGNRRYAEARGSDREAGHRQGFNRVSLLPLLALNQPHFVLRIDNRLCWLREVA